MTRYRERLTAPASWWVSALGFAIVWGWILLVATTWPIAVATTVVVAILTLTAVWWYGSVLIQVDAHQLRVGRAHIALAHLGRVTALDHAEYQQRLGVGADARAHLATRPYLDHGVLIEVADDSDPTPYWLVSSRQPQALAGALGGTAHNAAPGGTTGHSDGQDPGGEGSRGEED